MNDKKSENLLEKQTDTGTEEARPFSHRLKDAFWRSFTIKPIDIAVASFLLASFLIVYWILGITGLQRIIRGEILFYILFGLVFGSLKGGLLAFLADILGMLITGNIGTWYWLYGIFAPIIAIVSSWYFLLFKTNKTTKTIIPFVIIILAFITMILIFARAWLDENNKKRTLKNLSLGLIIFGIVLFCFLTIGAIVVVCVYYRKKLNEKILDYLMIFSLVTFIIVVYRWALGPIIFMKYMNYMHQKSYVIKDKYLYFAVPIIIESILNIPVYTVLLCSLYPVVNSLKEKHIENRYKISY